VEAASGAHLESYVKDMTSPTLFLPNTPDAHFATNYVVVEDLNSARCVRIEVRDAVTLEATVLQTQGFARLGDDCLEKCGSDGGHLEPSAKRNSGQYCMMRPNGEVLTLLLHHNQAQASVGKVVAVYARGDRQHRRYCGWTSGILLQTDAASLTSPLPEPTPLALSEQYLRLLRGCDNVRFHDAMEYRDVPPMTLDMAADLALRSFVYRRLFAGGVTPALATARAVRVAFERQLKYEAPSVPEDAYIRITQTPFPMLEAGSVWSDINQLDPTKPNAQDGCARAFAVVGESGSARASWVPTEAAIGSPVFMFLPEDQAPLVEVFQIAAAKKLTLHATPLIVPGVSIPRAYKVDVEEKTCLMRDLRATLQHLQAAGIHGITRHAFEQQIRNNEELPPTLWTPSQSVSSAGKIIEVWACPDDNAMEKPLNEARQACIRAGVGNAHYAPIQWERCPRSRVGEARREIRFERTTHLAENIAGTYGLPEVRVLERIRQSRTLEDPTSPQPSDIGPVGDTEEWLAQRDAGLVEYSPSAADLDTTPEPEVVSELAREIPPEAVVSFLGIHGRYDPMSPARITFDLRERTLVVKSRDPPPSFKDLADGFDTELHRLTHEPSQGWGGALSRANMLLAEDFGANYGQLIQQGSAPSAALCSALLGIPTCRDGFALFTSPTDVTDSSISFIAKHPSAVRDAIHRLNEESASGNIRAPITNLLRQALKGLSGSTTIAASMSSGLARTAHMPDPGADITDLIVSHARAAGRGSLTLKNMRKKRGKETQECLSEDDL
jgi:hypothetical protein